MACFTRCVRSCVTTMATPGTAAPLESTTVPEIRPVSWARARDPARARSTTTGAMRPLEGNDRMTLPPTQDDLCRLETDWQGRYGGEETATSEFTVSDGTTPEGARGGAPGAGQRYREAGAI